ncbi:MAG: N-alpha-acetyl diaminobutyric acid deacetylase DoeB [Actinomycetia bacterium]|nr:N-alpha-acetyl diaminobutyric acid deacetylase DoeB [Actinomycetes bacterium]
MPPNPPHPPSTISPTVDFDLDGRQHGHLVLPHSHDEAAYGAVMIPIAVIKNGDGPTVLLTGGNHGDEYQGVLSLIKLANTLDPSCIAGRVIVVPCMNQPAFAAGTRTSPIDKGNLNRSFPGRPDGTHTERIADYVTRTLLPMADAVLDLHDGGRTLDFIPLASSMILADDPETEARSQAAAEAFGAPYVTKLVELDTLGMWDVVVTASGRPFVTTGLGGTGGTRPEIVKITDAGVHNVLVHWGVLSDDPVAGSPSAHIRVPEVDGYVLSTSDGLLEWLVDLGGPVEVGQVIARVHGTKRLGENPVDYRATVDGILAMRHHPGLVKMGDAIAMQATLE